MTKRRSTRLFGPGIAAVIVLALLSPVVGGSRPGSMRNAAAVVKPILTGLLVRDGEPQASDLTRLDGWVVRVNWSDLQPTAFGPIAGNNAIDQSIAAVRADAPTDHLKIRVVAGTTAPLWAKQLDGPPVQLDADPADTIGRFWAPGFKAAYNDLEAKLAAKYDSVPEVSQVEIGRCTIWTVEPFLRDAGTPATVSALLAAGYTASADETCQREEIDAHQVWTTTRSGLAFNPYQRLFPDGSSSVDEAFTESMMTYCRSSLGSRCILANNSIRWPVQSGSYPAMYSAMQQGGQPIAFQTAAATQIGDWYQALNWAVQLGANSIELNRNYTTYDPTQLDSIRQRLLVTAPPAAGTSFVTSFTKTNLRNDWAGWLGYKFTVGNADITVGSLGRYVVPGNTSTHLVKVVDASTGTDVTGGGVTVATAGATADAFTYASLPAALTLKANASYYLVSQETAGGDRWYDYSTNVVTNPAASVKGIAYSSASTPSNWTLAGGPGNAFGPLSFLFGDPGSPPPPPPPSGTSFVTSFTKTTLRNDWSGWLGYKFTVGNAAVSVGSLGRYVVAGTTGTHQVKIVDASTGADVAGGTTSVATSGAAADAFAYAALPSPITLSANKAYYVVSQETSGGDRWYDYTTALVTSPAGGVNSFVFSSASSPASWSLGGAAGQGFIPVSFLYTGSPPPPPTSGTSFVTSFTKTNLRNDWAGWVGYKFTVGAANVSVTSLGRYVVPGNSGSHMVKIVNAANGLDVSGAVATVATSGATADAFAYTALPSAVTLTANTAYYLVSQETVGGDRWYDYTTNALTTSVGSIGGIAYSSASTPASFTVAGGSGNAFGPLSFLYGGSISPPPPPTSGTSFVTSFTKTNLRNDWAGWVGYKFTVGAANVSVTSLGRYVVPGNSGSHMVKIVNAANGLDVSGAVATVATSGATADAFAYTALPSAVTLTANTAYYLVSQETVGGDRWYDYTTNALTTSVGSIGGIAYSSASTPASFTVAGGSGNAFGPLSFLYA